MKAMNAILCGLGLLLAPALQAQDDWTLKSPDTQPSARYLPAMASLGGDQVLLFGGEDAAGNNDETWVYDLSDNTWTLKSPVTKPSARKYHAMASLGGDQVLLFSGRDAGGDDDETWVYDLSDNTWTFKNPAAKPSARAAHGMAFLGGDQVLLFGGNDGSEDDETWIYDLSDNLWTIQSPAARPSPRNSHAMASIGGDQVLLFGGFVGSYNDETWVYDLSDNNWTMQSPTVKPVSRVHIAMASLSCDQVLLFGGAAPTVNDETWVYDLSDNTWTLKTPAAKPSARVFHAMAPLGDYQVLLFGGAYDVRFDDETWVYAATPAPVSIDVTTSPAGLDIDVDGTSYTSPQTFQWVPGSSHTIATISPQSLVAGTQYVFLNWSDAGAISHDVTAPASPTTYTASFKTQHELTTSASPAVGGTISPASGFYDEGNVEITATANSGYIFTGFSGALTGTTNPQTLNLTGPAAVTANFCSPVITTAEPISLWPPNQKYQTFTVAQCVVSVSGCPDFSVNDVVITQVTSDEQEDAPGDGDGNTVNDIVIAGDCKSVQLRCERQGSGNGRVYTIHLSVDAGNGNIGAATCLITVPKSQNGNPAVDDGPAYTETGSCGSVSKMTGSEEASTEATLPEGYALEQNYPNPFNPTTIISFELPVDSEVSLAIYNMSGQLVKKLVAGEMNAGRHSLVWDATDDRGARVASGAYLYVIKAGSFTAQKKLVLMK